MPTSQSPNRGNKCWFLPIIPIIALLIWPTGIFPSLIKKWCFKIRRMVQLSLSHPESCNVFHFSKTPWCDYSNNLQAAWGQQPGIVWHVCIWWCLRLTGLDCLLKEVWWTWMTHLLLVPGKIHFTLLQKFSNWDNATPQPESLCLEGVGEGRRQCQSPRSEGPRLQFTYYSQCWAPGHECGEPCEGL